MLKKKIGAEKIAATEIFQDVAINGDGCPHLL
jgi:hypothetical protein